MKQLRTVVLLLILHFSAYTQQEPEAIQFFKQWSVGVSYKDTQQVEDAISHLKDLITKGSIHAEFLYECIDNQINFNSNPLFNPNQIEQSVVRLEKSRIKQSASAAYINHAYSIVYFEMQDLNKEQDLVKKALNIINESCPNDTLLLLKVKNSLNSNYGFQGDFFTEISLQREVLSMLSAYLPKDNVEIRAKEILWFEINNNLSIAYTATKQPELAYLAAKSASQALFKIDPNDIQHAISDQVIARSQAELFGNYDSAHFYIDRCLARLDTGSFHGIPTHGSPYWYAYSAYKAEHYAGEEKYAEVHSFLEPLILEFEQNEVMDYQSLGPVQNLRLKNADAYIQQGEPENAEEFLKAAENDLVYPMISKDIITVKIHDLRLTQAISTKDTNLILERIKELENFCIKTTGFSENDLDTLAWHDFKRIDAITLIGDGYFALAELALKSGQQASALKHLKQSFETYLQATKTTHLRTELFFDGLLHQAVIESPRDPLKGLLLAGKKIEELTNERQYVDQAKFWLGQHKGGLLSSLVERKKHLAKVATQEEIQVLDNLQKSSIESYAGYLNETNLNISELVTNQNEYFKNIQLLENKYKLSSSSHENYELPKIDDKTIVLDYYISGETMIVLKRKANSDFLVVKKVPSNLSDLCSKWNKHNSLIGNSYNNFKDQKTLEDYLLGQIVDKSDFGYNLIVIPHREIALIAFEALHTPGTERLLVEDFPIHYLTGEWQIDQASNSTVSASPEMRIGGFSCTNFGGKNDPNEELFNNLVLGGKIQDLLHTFIGTEEICKFLNGEHFPNATVSKFLALAETYDILHIGTHGVATQFGNQNAFLRFEPTEEKTTINRAEISGLNLHAKLVTLGACETALGPVRGGEGITSLCKSFFQAGAESVVASLWSVPDSISKVILVDFYKELANGKLKSEALRDAKLNFISKNPQYSAPFYWAGFIVVGDDETIPLKIQKSNFSWLLYAAIGLALTILLYLLIKRRSS